MKINKVHCLFEQSGTFKNVFKKLGYDAYDYDIQNEFGQTDYVVDLYQNIRDAYDSKPSIFDNIQKDDLIFSFFPCTRFEAQILLFFRGDAYQNKGKDDLFKLEQDLRLHEELHENYELITKLAIICIRGGYKMVFENPYNEQHYLRRYWALEPAVIDYDRTQNGDYYKKPTQYWFIGFEPENNLVMEPLDYVPYHTVDKGIDGIRKTTARSMIHPQYAERFIKKYIIDYETNITEVWGFNPYQE